MPRLTGDEGSDPHCGEGAGGMERKGQKTQHRETTDRSLRGRRPPSATEDPPLPSVAAQRPPPATVIP